MPKQPLTDDEYIEDLNRQLRLHQNYRDPMAFLPSPPGSTGRGMTGYSVNGPFSEMGVYAAIANNVSGQFCLKAE